MTETNRNKHTVISDFDAPLPKGMIDAYDTSIGKWVLCRPEEAWQYGNDAADSRNEDEEIVERNKGETDA